ncbi:GDSL-type esterase/lipase family protein [Pseudonocardia sp. TRM90224]|uniref:GDSL-type esterase/lipase family protein n=1 Tax=Pseudonocardia sp. TRM90224 TaxID=2812678 RepID=UPI001E5D3AD3|nr:GDSL-type esterase/lipase family protein [Pseudonocardia sp. TRM90224]
MPRSRLAAAAAIALVSCLAVLAPATAGVATAAPRGPETVVVLGDSAASGEGAGDYEQGTRGENDNWCHRSPHAYVHRTSLAPESVNLACSGARSADVGFGAPGHYTEPSQAGRLIEVAARLRVTTVIVQLGANDDAALTGTGIACIRAFIDPTEPPCRQTLGPLIADRMAATAPKVEAAVRDVRSAMRQAGYGTGDYTLVLASYASPVTENMIPLQGAFGCPYSRPDAGWGRTQLFPALASALRGVADRTGARFLDLTRATEGFEACSRPLKSEEWQRRITVDPEPLVYGGLDAIGYHLAQESFHPTVAAHAGMGRCVGQLVRSGAPAGSCVAGADGNVHLETSQPAPAQA